MLALYVHRASPIHAAPAGVKVGALAILGVTALALPLAAVVALLGAVLGGYAAARLPLRALGDAVRPLLWLSGMLIAIHAALGTPLAGLAAALRFLLVILAACLVTLTTREAEMRAVLAAAARPLRHVGVAPPLVALGLALALRFIPLTLADYHAIADAARARNARWPGLAALAPLIIRVLKRANHLADAIAARGFDPKG